MIHVQSDAIWAIADTLVRALESDPFYYALTPGLTAAFDRRPLLHDYFVYMLREQARTPGSCLMETAEDGHSAIALWNRPVSAEASRRALSHKILFVRKHLGHQAAENLVRMCDFLHRQTHGRIPAGAWYLSLMAVHPREQGEHLGSNVLQSTLRQIDQRAASSYLDTFSLRAVPFYERSGFEVVANEIEPVTQARCWLMLRRAAGVTA